MTIVDPIQNGHSQRRATRSSERRGHGRSPTKAASTAALHAPSKEGEAEGAPSGPDQEQEDITCVGFKVLFFGDTYVEDRLRTMRDWQHWLINSACDAWRYADKVASRTAAKDGDEQKMVRCRAEVTQAVKDACDRQRAYSLKVLERTQQGIEKLRAKLGTARGKNRTGEVADLEAALAAETRKATRLLDASILDLPSSLRDGLALQASQTGAKYMKARGAMAFPSFQWPQPINIRDGEWQIEATDKRGAYRLTFPMGMKGKAVERGSVTIVPDSGSAYAFAKTMIDGTAKLCNARLTWAKKKCQWFAKLTIRYKRLRPDPITDGGTCAVRQGVHNALVIAFETGDVEVIRGTDLVRYKDRHRARYDEIRNHLRSREAGAGARGRGKKRRFKALDRLGEREENHVNTTIGRWSRLVLNAMKARNASTICVALDPSSMSDRHAADDEGARIVQAFVNQFPRAKFRDAIERVVTGDGRTFRKVATVLDARTCPGCGHFHEARPKGETFHCEVCGAAAPADHVAAWNLLADVVGSRVPFRERLKKRADLLRRVGAEVDEAR